MRDITACLVTRGDQPEMMERIRESLIFDNVIVWDNSREPDWKCAGRYMAAAMSPTDLVYYQDDDVIVPQATQRILVEEFFNSYGTDIVANWGHGENPDGYDDLPLVCGGAVGSRKACWAAIRRYAEHWPLDEEFMYEADFVVGALYESFEHVLLPFDIDLSIAQHPSRLCNQPWQRDLKLEITNRARAIRDMGYSGEARAAGPPRTPGWSSETDAPDGALVFQEDVGEKRLGVGVPKATPLLQCNSPAPEST